MGLFRHIDSFSITQGAQPIVVAAPHDGTRPNVDSDLFTGPIAQALACRLNARMVIVSDLRRTVDVNKNPLGLQKSVRHHALRYQNEVFRGLPRLVLEIHGHVGGQYPIEISSGFDLDSASPGDALFLERLRQFQQVLPAQLGKIGLPIGVGIYPLNRDVRKTATNTYTFQKIRRARNRVGVEWYGLHIELATDLRTSKRAKAPGYFESLAESFAAAIRSAFEPLPGPTAFIPTHADVHDDEPVASTRLRATKAPEDLVEKTVVILNPQEISTLGFLEGDFLPLYNHGETLRVPALSSSNVMPGKIAIPARVRRQLDLNPGDWVTVLQPIRENGQTVHDNDRAFLIGEVRPGTLLQIWIHPIGLQRLRTGVLHTIHLCTGPFPGTNPVPVQLIPEESLWERKIVASDALMRKLTLTIGDTVTLETKV